MIAQRRRALLLTVAAVVAAWLLALVGYWVGVKSKMTADKVRAYAQSVDLGKLSVSDRARALQKLANKLNALPYEERQRARFDRVGMLWFNQMTEAEKSEFVEQTLPTGFKQMIASFEQLPEEKRRLAIDRAMRDLRETRNRSQAGEPNPGGQRPEGAPEVTPEMQEQIRKIGLRTYFAEASAQTKAELAPLLEELQQAMESGRFIPGVRSR